MSDAWNRIGEWPELYLERMAGAGVARVTLNRPDKRNALNGALVEAFLAALDQVRADAELKVLVTRGAGPAFSAGVDLHFLREFEQAPPPDWDRPLATIRLVQALREFPRITIAQVHGHCLGGSMGLMNVHDLAIAADTAQIGMPEVPRGSFGQVATSTLFHSGIAPKKAAFMALTGRYLSGVEADRLGLVSLCAPEAELEGVVNAVATQIAAHKLATLQHHKIAVQMGSDLPLADALRIDQLVGERQARALDPTADVDGWLKSRKR